MEGEIEEGDLIEIRRLLKVKTADMGDKNSAQSLINKYINPGMKWCMTCDGAVRQMFKVLRGWSEEKGIAL